MYVLSMWYNVVKIYMAVFILLSRCCFLNCVLVKQKLCSGEDTSQSHKGYSEYCTQVIKAIGSLGSLNPLLGSHFRNFTIARPCLLLF